MKLWIDDVRPAPEGYIHFKAVNEALRYIRLNYKQIDLIDLDHDAGDFVTEGRDFIEILKELERLSHLHNPEGASWGAFLRQRIAFRLHSANPVGVQNMRAIIKANGWKEIK